MGKFEDVQDQLNGAQPKEKLDYLLTALFNKNGIAPAPNADDAWFWGVCVKHDDAYRDYTVIENIRLISKEGLSKILTNPFSSRDLTASVRFADDIEHKLHEKYYALFRVLPGRLTKPHEIFKAQIRWSGKEETDFTYDDPQVWRTLEVFFHNPSLKDIYDVSSRFVKAKEEQQKIIEQTEAEKGILKTIQSDRESIEKERNALLKEKKGIEKELDDLQQKNKQAREALSNLRLFLPPEMNDSLSSKKLPQIESVKLTLDETATLLGYNYGADKNAENATKHLREIVVSFLMSLGTTQIVTLHGKPGTGKTTFVGRIAAALGAKLTMISVQNNWTDASDLMGYYNPIEKTYQSTLFLDALLDARNEPSRLHIICLDEMNLARIEYYFATFLSLLQLEKDDRVINLLPKDVEAKVAADPSAYEELSKYRTFLLPPNIRFVGTLNFDESATLPSPKVVDRSFYICFDDVTPCRFEEITPEKYITFSFFSPSEDTDYLPDAKQNARHNKYVQQMHSMFAKLKGDETEFSALIRQGRPSYKELRQRWEDQMFGEEG